MSEKFSTQLKGADILVYRVEHSAIVLDNINLHWVTANNFQKLMISNL